MNEATRKRAVEVIREAMMRSPREVRPYEVLDALLAAGIHVAEWRDVAEARTEDVPFLVSDGTYRWIMNKWPEDAEIINSWLGEDRKPTKIMDLPEPPKQSS